MKNAMLVWVIVMYTVIAFAAGFALQYYFTQHITNNPSPIVHVRNEQHEIIPECRGTNAVEFGGWATRNLKYKSLTHSSWDSRETAEKFTRKMNTDNIIDYTPMEYDTVEVYVKELIPTQKEE